MAILLNPHLSALGASQLPWYSNMEQDRALWKRLAAEAGLNLVDGSFEEGAEVTSSSDVVWWQAGSAIYGWHLNEVKTVPTGSTPETSGGIGAGAWVDRTDVVLRDQLAESTGATKIGTSDGRTVEQRLAALPNEVDTAWVENTREAVIAMAASQVLTQSIIVANHAFV